MQENEGNGLPNSKENEPLEDIMAQFNEFFSEDGKLSSMRLMSMIALVAAILFGLITLLNPKSAGLNLVVAFLTAAFGAKAAQKFAEAKETEKAAAVNENQKAAAVNENQKAAAATA